MPINDIRNNIVNNLIIIGVEISTPFILSLAMSENFLSDNRTGALREILLF